MKFIGSKFPLKMEDTTQDFDKDGYPLPAGVSLMSPAVCSAILCNYSKLKQDSAECFEGDTWYLMYDFDKLSDKALKDYPLYERLV